MTYAPLRKTKYQNSVCRGHFLHKFKQITITDRGSLERCERCGMQKMFVNGMPNHIYLSFHIREVLRADDPLFNREYKTQ